MTRKEIKKLDALWSKKIHTLGKHRCAYCGASGVWLNACHIIGRRYRATRFMVPNGMLLCKHHHDQYDEHGPLHNDILEKVVGYERFSELSKLAKQSIAKYQDFETIKKEIEQWLT